MAAVLKVSCADQLHRVVLAEGCITYEAVLGAIQRLYPNELPAVKYLDHEGNLSTLCQATFSDFINISGENSGKKILKVSLIVEKPGVRSGVFEGLSKEDSGFRECIEGHRKQRSEHSSSPQVPKMPTEHRFSKHQARSQKRAQDECRKFEGLWHMKEYYNASKDNRDKKEFYSTLHRQCPSLSSGQDGVLRTTTPMGRRNFWAIHNLLNQDLQLQCRSNYDESWYDRQPNGEVRCIYSNELLSDCHGNYVEDVYNPKTGKIDVNVEHTFPAHWKARLSNVGAARDPHNTFTSATSSNGARGKLPFGRVPPELCPWKSGKHQGPEVHGPFLKHFEGDENGKLKRTMLEPLHNKGLIAREQLYMLVTYPVVAKASNLEGLPLEWLVDTARHEPVTLFEKHRNQAIYEVQYNRNPFIDFPEWVDLVDFTEGLRPDDCDPYIPAEFLGLTGKQKKVRRQEIEAGMTKMQIRERRERMKTEQVAPREDLIRERKLRALQ